MITRATKNTWRQVQCVFRSYLFSLTQQLSLLLQDLFVKLRVKQEAAALSLRQRTAEVSEALLEAILRNPQLKEESTSERNKTRGSKCTDHCTVISYFMLQEYLSVSLFSSLHQLLDERLHNLWPLRGQSVLQWGFLPQL